MNFLDFIKANCYFSRLKVGKCAHMLVCVSTLCFFTFDEEALTCAIVKLRKAVTKGSTKVLLVEQSFLKDLAK